MKILAWLREVYVGLRRNLRTLRAALSLLGDPGERQARQWILQARWGHLDAFDRLVSMFQRDVFHIAFYRLRDEQRAVEETIEVFFELYRSLRRISYLEPIRIWICRFAFERDKGNAERRPIHATKPADVRKWLEILNCFPAEQVDALVLHQVLDFSYGDAGQILGTSPGTIKTRLHAIRMDLQEAMEEVAGS